MAAAASIFVNACRHQMRFEISRLVAHLQLREVLASMFSLSSGFKATASHDISKLTIHLMTAL